MVFYAKLRFMKNSVSWRASLREKLRFMKNCVSWKIAQQFDAALRRMCWDSISATLLVFAETYANGKFPGQKHATK